MQHTHTRCLRRWFEIHRTNFTTECSGPNVANTTNVSICQTEITLHRIVSLALSLPHFHSPLGKQFRLALTHWTFVPICVCRSFMCIWTECLTRFLRFPCARCRFAYKYRRWCRLRSSLFHQYISSGGCAEGQRFYEPEWAVFKLA